MRIIGGDLGGRRVQPPTNQWPTRPTTDFAREALFNILAHQIDLSESSVLDLFGGSGMISIEAISRGCTAVTFVDRHRPCVQWVQRITKELGITDDITILKQDAVRYMTSSKAQFDLVFADPPYDWPKMQDLPQMIFDHNLVADDGLAVIEHAPQTHMDHLPHWKEDRKYGSSVFSFFTN